MLKVLPVPAGPSRQTLTPGRVGLFLGCSWMSPKCRGLVLHNPQKVPKSPRQYCFPCLYGRCRFTSIFATKASPSRMS